MRIIRKPAKKSFSNVRKPVIRKKFSKKNFGRDTVEIDKDLFIDMLWERINSSEFGEYYPETFWQEVIDYLSDIGFLSPEQNHPSYIIDNIAVNGEIFDISEESLKEHLNNKELKEFKEDYNGDVQKWANDQGYLFFDEYIVINLGL